MAIATAMYYTGIDPLTNKPVYSATDLREKKMMKALLFYWDEQHWPLAREALRKANRHDLIGRGPRCLIPPEHADRNTVPRPSDGRERGRGRPLRAKTGTRRGP